MREAQSREVLRKMGRRKERRRLADPVSKMAEKSNGGFIGNENENLTDRLLHQAYIGHKLPCLHICCRSAAGRIKVCHSSLLSPVYLALVPLCTRSSKVSQNLSKAAYKLYNITDWGWVGWSKEHKFFISSYWKSLSRMWRITQIEEDVIRVSLSG